ncbi:T9SS type A sorting domain-containing protein [Prevotella sp. P4-119]|uniref:T9SS type A sorting domain-containing protein n=1 Tax=Prevotella sp. P4-119 TaxID=2024218 RepID=UPI00117F2E1A|nr:T9SS type A sorting domain-containing protein [Prevotella sp. P4-119]
MIKKFRYIYVCLIAVLACCVSTSVSAQSVFAHYKGVNDMPYIRNPYGIEMQQVHEYEYTYYVTGGREIDLPLPFENYTKEQNTDIEPKGYIRWYDYNTDMANPRLSVYNTTNLKEVNDNNDKARGLFAWKNKTNSEPSGPNRNKVGVKYKAPTDADDATWKGEDVACDVSKYTDFEPMVSGQDQYFTHEPTLQIRYIFHIRPAKAMAENIIKTTATDLRTADSDLTIEDNRRIVFGAKDANAKMSVRVNYKPSNYFFYPLKPKDGKQRHLLSSDEAHSIKQADYDKSTLYNANGFVWLAYDETKTKYTVLISSGTVQLHNSTSMNVLMKNGNGWKNLDGTPTTKPNITFGSIVYLVAYAYYNNNSIKAPIASFEILYQNTYPKTMKQLTDDGDNERTLAYFESHYKQVTKPISFDDDNDKLTMVAPTVENNMAHYASRWDRRAYSFVYPELRDYACPNRMALIHGEYGLFKSANLAGISDNSVTSTTGKTLYKWWNSAVLHDRTHAITNGKQYGYFLYVDASDESRQIASIDFKADLCSGARLIFSAAVTDFTGSHASEQPQVLFKIYGIIKDENDKVTHQRLLTSFTSGDFASNTKGGRQLGTWFQVYSRIVMRKNMGVENYSDFRIVLDNMCANTTGADYAIDDIRLYIQHAKVDVLQNQPACPDAKSGSIANHEITLKITSHYENVQAITGVGKESKLFYRISDMDGKPFAGIDYNGDGTADEYGEVTIPANYDASSSAFEIDPEGHVILVIDNRHFDLPLGKKFYVSVAYPDADGNPDEWGKFTDECSSYSDAFSIVQQKVVISDANGSVVTTVRVSCDGNSTPDVDINAKLETADKVGGGSILLNNVKFDWFVGTPDGADNKFSSISGLQEALGNYRLKFPNATSLNATFQTSNPADYDILDKYIKGVDGEGTLVLAVSNSLTGYKFKQVGTYKIATVPIKTSIKQGTVTYEICPQPMYFTIRIVENGPKLILGFDKVVYPTDDRAVRIGLPQIREMLKKADNGMLILPVVELNNGKDENIEIKFLDDQKVFISDSNDPTFTSTKQIVGKLKEETLASGKKTLGLVFDDNVLDILHEGYWYELNFSYELHNSTTTAACPGDLFITLKVVPEYLTWFPTVANKLNANWNNDLNWKRSTAAELYDKKYEDYGEATYDNTANSSLTRQQAYTPMKFSKVVIPENKLVYPGLGNIVYRVSNDIATKLTNFKGEEATSGIAYDFVVTWNDNTADPDDHSTDGNGTFKCETFHGNLCDQIFFKAQAELLNQPYLIYNKAFVEKEVESNKWNLVSTPMKNIYAGDFFVPKTTGREESKTAFSAMNFDGTSDNRVAAPVYQRNWDSNETQIVDGGTQYKVHDFDGNNISIESISDASMNVESLYWSHVYNKLDENYSEGKGFALKAGDQYKTLSAKWLFRLPKEDEEYKYFEPDGGYSDLKVSVPKHEKYMLNVPYSNEPGLLGEISQPLTSNTHSNNRYYIVGNPYTASLSMYQFLNGNPSFERKVWTLVDGVLKAHSVPEGTYNRSQDYIIEPMQGFFVKVKEGETVSQANFTLMMTTDRWISGGTAVQEPAAVYINVVNDDHLCSTAKVVVCNDADDEFVDDEDVELLNNSDIEDVPQVYTVAGNQAVALNKLSNINFLPLGIIAKVDGNVMSNGATVNVEISANRYVTDKLFVFDAKMGTFTPADAPISIMANEHGRYYITTSTYNLKQHNDEANIKCFSPNSGTITVSSPNIAIANVRIYNFEGLLVTSALGINQASWTKNIGCGLYIVKAETKDGQSKTFKLSVR